MTVIVPLTSKEYVYVPNITAFLAGNEQAVTTLPVDCAYVVGTANPIESDWVVVSWLAGATTPTVKILVGVGGNINPPIGTSVLWIRVRGAVERPQRPVDKIKRI